MNERASPARLPLGWILLVPLPLLLLAYSGVRISDDAYIGFRYAQRFASGEGLTFNPGERVEGFTNLGWTVLLAAPARLGVPLERAAAALGLFCGLLALFVTARACLALRLDPWASTIALGWFALLPAFWLTVTNGLEGGLFALLLALAVRGLLCNGGAWSIGLWGGALYLVRPESLLLLPCFALACADRTPDSVALPRPRLARRLALVSAWLAVVAATTLVRLAYFGAALPNTIAAKTPPQWSFELVRVHLEACLAYYGGFLLACLPLTLGVALAPLAGGQRRRTTWFLVALLAAPAPAIFVNGGDWMARFRLLSIYAPALALATGLLLDRALRYQSTSAGRTRGALALLALTGGWVVALRDHRWQPLTSFSVRPALPCWADLAAALAPVARGDDLLAPEALGVFGYRLPEVKMHDFLGLTDRHLAQRGSEFHRRYGTGDSTYTFASRPTAILVHSGSGHLAPIVRAADGAFDSLYETFELAAMPASCHESGWLVSLRRDATPRLAPALDRFALHAVDAPVR